MGSPINFGSRKFGTRNQGKLQQDQSVKRQARWASVTSNVALIAIGNTATFAATLPVVPGSSLIILKNIICIALFVDSSTGATYNVSEQVNLYLYPQSFANLDYVAGAAIPRFPFQGSGMEYEILGNVGALATFAIDATIYGGDVVAKTLITPGAGDQVAFYLSALYEPL